MPTPLLPFRSSHCGCASVVSICACVLAVTAGCASDSEPTSSTSSSRAAAPANTSATASPSTAASTSPTSVSPSQVSNVPVFISNACSLVPSLHAFTALGMDVSDLEEVSLISGRSTEETEALKMGNSTAVALGSCNTWGISLVLKQFPTMDLAHADTAENVGANPLDVTAITTDAAGISGAKTIMNPETGTGGVQWTVEPGISVSLIANFDSDKGIADAVKSELERTAQNVNSRIS